MIPASLEQIRSVIVLTGGPGAGKTAVLELARRELCSHVEFLPEAASIVFSGGFPRIGTAHGFRCAQRAIYRVQVELENALLLNDSVSSGIANAAHRKLLAVCDRGTVDSLAYWPNGDEQFFQDVGSTYDVEIARYTKVIHLRVPETAGEYKQSALRRETHPEARAIDERLLDAWSKHPNRIVIQGARDFMDKARAALQAIRGELTLDHDCL